MTLAMRTGRPLSPEERRARDSKRKAMAAISLAVLLVLGAILSLRLASKWNPELSEADLCPVDRPPTEELVILLDATDPWNSIQKAVIAREFRRLQDSVARHARVTLYTLDTEFTGLPVPALRLCNPGNLEDFDDFPLIGPGGVSVVANPDSVQRRWTEGFVAKLDSVFDEQAESAGSERSPLLEMIRGAAIDVFGSLDAPKVPRRAMYVFSDLLQHSNVYSLYSDPSWTASRGRALADLSLAGTTALAGVDVYFFMLDRDLPRATSGQNRSRLIEFWDAYLAEQDATLVKVRRIER